MRAFIMRHVLVPLARWSNVKKKKYDRFAEQGYSFIYYTISCSFGVVRIIIFIYIWKQSIFLVIIPVIANELFFLRYIVYYVSFTLVG